MPRRRLRRNSEVNVPVIDLISGSELPPRSDRNDDGDESAKATGSSSSSWMDEEPLDRVAASLRRVRRYLRAPAPSGLPRVRRRRKKPQRAPRYDCDADEEPESGDSSESLESPRPRPRVEELADDEEEYAPVQRRTMSTMPHPTMPEQEESDESDGDQSEDERLGSEDRSLSPRAVVHGEVIDVDGHGAQYISSGEDGDRSSSPSSVIAVEHSVPIRRNADEPELMDLVSPEQSPLRDEFQSDSPQFAGSYIEAGRNGDGSERAQADAPPLQLSPLPMRAAEVLGAGEGHARRSSAREQVTAPLPSSGQQRWRTPTFGIRNSPVRDASGVGGTALDRSASLMRWSRTSEHPQVHPSPRIERRSATASPTTPSSIALRSSLPAQVERLALNISSSNPRQQTNADSENKDGTAKATTNSNPDTASPHIASPACGLEQERTPFSLGPPAKPASPGVLDKPASQSPLEAAKSDLDMWSGALWSEAKAAYRHFASNLGRETKYPCATMSNNTLLKVMRHVGQLLGARPLTVPNNSLRYVELIRGRDATGFPTSENDFRKQFQAMLTNFFVAEHTKDALATGPMAYRMPYQAQNAVQRERPSPAPAQSPTPRSLAASPQLRQHSIQNVEGGPLERRRDQDPHHSTSGRRHTNDLATNSGLHDSGPAARAAASHPSSSVPQRRKERTSVRPQHEQQRSRSGERPNHKRVYNDTREIVLLPSDRDSAERRTGTVRERSQGEERRRSRHRPSRRHRHGEGMRDSELNSIQYRTHSEERGAADTPRVARPPDRVGGRIEKRRKRSKRKNKINESWGREYSAEQHSRGSSRDDRYHRRKRRHARQHWGEDRLQRDDGSGGHRHRRQRYEHRDK